jgi:hypothetical protein
MQGGVQYAEIGLAQNGKSCTETRFGVNNAVLSR